MPTFKVYLELYGKKLIKKVVAENQFHAQSIVEKSIKFHKIVKSEDPFDEAVEFLDKIIKK